MIVRHARCIVICLATMPCLSAMGFSQEIQMMRVVYWNLYGGQQSEDRGAAIRAVILGLRPDVLIVQNLLTDSDTSLVAWGFRDAQQDSRHELIFYTGLDKTYYMASGDKFEALTAMSSPIMGIEQSGVTFRPIGGQAFCVLVPSWSGSSPSDGISHTASASILLSMAVSAENRDSCHGRMIFVGKFNALGSSDSGLRYIMDSRLMASPMVDIGDFTGQWDSNQTAAYLHTASTVQGLVTRPTMALVSSDLRSAIASWSIYGNDGNHYGLSVASGVNDSVGKDVAEQLEVASPSLPIVIDISLTRSSVTNEQRDADSLNLQ